MADADETCDTILRELNNVVSCDTDRTKEEQESFSSHQEADIDDIPASLLSYFETSKSRAAVCEKLILEEPEDFPASHHTEDMMNLPIELDKDMMKLNRQVVCDSENEDNNTSTDTRLLPAPTETETVFTHNVSVCPNNEDEAGRDEYIEVRTLEMSINEDERKISSEYEAEREKQRCEEMNKEEQKRQIERDFQKELKKIMEAEKLHQKELELMEKRSQEKLEQELLLQQELMSNLRRRVEEEKKLMEAEQKRMKDEEDKRNREEEKIKIEAVKKRMEEETRKKKEEERKIEEMKLKEEEERKNEEEEKKRMEREKKRKREEERNKLHLEKKNLEVEMRMMKEEEERIKKEEEGKKEEERKKIEAARKKMEIEKRKMEEEMSLKEDRKKRENENIKIVKEGRITKETEERKKQEEMKKIKEEEEEAGDVCKKMYEVMRMRDKDEEIKLEEKKKKEEQDGKKREEGENGEGRERERNMMEEKEVVRKKEGENRKIKEELRPIEDEKRKKEDERKTKEEEWRRRQRDEEDYRKSEEEEIRLKEHMEGYKGYDVDNGKMEHESKTYDKERNQEEEKKLEEEEIRKREEEINVKALKEQNGEEVGENKKEVNKNTEEEIRLKENEERKKKMVQVRKKELTLNELQEKRENNMTGQNEKMNVDKTETSLTSELEDSTIWTLSSPGPLHNESTIFPTRPKAIPQQHDSDKNISQTSTDKTVDCENQAARPSTVSVFLPVCLPEQKRLAWMKDCIPWSKLCLQNRRKQKGSVRSRRGLRRDAEASRLPPLCPDFLLQSTGWKSLQEVTTVNLEDLPGCSLSTLAQCTQLRSLTLRRCGLKSLEGIKQLPQLCYINVQENNISFVDCENMTYLRVLQLGHNKLTSIHGLAGAENLDVLDLSHNSITRIAGLESMRRLQRLSVDHNQLISTKGLRDVYTLLYLNCSHNHLASVEGLENSALLNTLDLRANSLTEPPDLNNQVLLRELHLDDNSISSLQGLTACWLPLLQHLSVAQNRITQLPSMSDSVSLANLDLRFNCMSELQNVCKSLEGCQFLREVHLTGNPLQQESGWRSTLQKAVPGLRAIDDEEADYFLSPPAAQQVILASGSFLTFCQAQLQQTHDLQHQHSRELSNASSSLEAVKISCRHFTEVLQLAKDQRFAHEYGDTTVAAGRTTPVETLDMDRTSAEKHPERQETECTGKDPLVIPNRVNIRCRHWTSEEKSATGPQTGPTVGKAYSGSVHSLATRRKTTSSSLEMAPVSNLQHLDLQNTAAVVIQQLWRKYRQKCGNISSPATAEKGGGRGGDAGKPESGPSCINESVVGQDHAATVIQAFWRGFTLRRRLASALAAVTCPDTGEDDTFEEVDVDEFVFDEAVLEKHWTLPFSEDSPPRRYPVSEQPLSLKPPGAFPEPSQYILPPPLVCRSKQAWVAAEQVDRQSAGQTVSPVSSNRSKSPATTSVLCGLSGRSEKILEEWGFTHSHTALLMLKRAQNMKSKKQQQKKHRDPSVRLALFRNRSYQLVPVEARNRQAQHNRNYIKVREAELGLQQAEKTERVKQERAQQWVHTQAAHSDRDSESAHFLPEISSDILNGGRVQLVADPGYTERLHHASGLWANSSLAAQPRKENNYPRRNSLGHARKEVPSPERVTSAPSKKERISYRDNPVQLSGGWGGGKKRDKV